MNGVAGGNSTLGTVSASGLYTAPAAVPSGGTVTVSAAAGGATGSATVTVTAPTNPPPGTRDPNALPAYDAFTGADQGPPIDSLWTGPLWSGESVWKRISNQAGPSAGGWSDTYATTGAARPAGIRMQVTTPPPSGSIMFTWMASSGFGGSPHASAKTGGQSFSKAGIDLVLDPAEVAFAPPLVAHAEHHAGTRQVAEHQHAQPERPEQAGELEGRGDRGGSPADALVEKVLRQHPPTADQQQQ